MKPKDKTQDQSNNIVIHRHNLAKLAHDLRTPLNTVIGFSQLLILKEQDHEKQRHLKAIQQAGETLLNMINDVIKPEASIEHEKTVDTSDFNVNNVSFLAADIIVADYSENNRELLVTILENWPITVRKAENGQQVLDMVQERIPDLIMTGIQMPILDGYQTASRLKSHEQTKHIPIIAVPALSPNKKLPHPESKMFDDYLIKPFNLSELVEAMMKILPYEFKPHQQPIVTSTSDLDKEALLKLPESLREEMHHSVVIGDFSQLRVLISRIDPHHKELVEGLLRLAEEYDQSRLQELFVD